VSQVISRNSVSPPVLQSIQPVISRFRWVNFHPERLDGAVASWGYLLENRSNWAHPCHFLDDPEETVRWIFVLDVLNHCFWADPGQPVWTVSYRGKSFSGYWGLAACLKRAMEQRFPITSAAYLARIPEHDLRGIFAGEGEIPMFAERLTNLREAGRVLQAHWQADIVHLVHAARESAVRTAALVVDSFPSFRDEAAYEGSTVAFWKRAQIFAADLYHAFSGKGWGAFPDIDRLTAFADYKLPQVLRHLGVLSYRDELAAQIDRRAELRAGSEEEVEIRAMTVWAVEALRIAFLNAGRRVTSMQIDNWLWQLGQLDAFRTKPYHRCRTIFY
jgi:hypothetical protein